MIENTKMAHYDLKTLVNYFGVSLNNVCSLASLPFENQIIEQLRLDSRQVKPNDLFIALKGQSHDGREFIPQAVMSGAIAILAETDNSVEDKTLSYFTFDGKKIPQINIYQLANRISAFANEFYDHPSSKMKVIGVTGTNGKTTVTQLIAQWASLIGQKSAVLGTVGNGVYGKLTPSANTTSSSIEIQSYLAAFLAEDVKIVAMEVSSHGLALGRVQDVSYAASLFTNLSRDHLDFHHTIKNYKNAKWSLFSPLTKELAVKHSGKRVINYDDKVGRAWINKLEDAVVVSTQPEYLTKIRALGKAYIGISSIEYHDKGVSLYFDSSFGNGVLESRLFGSFNVSNLLLALGALLALGFPFFALINTVPHLSPVCGRMEIFAVKNKPTVIVDYAHTPDALDKALFAAKEHCHGKLWVIFGCGGDRDRGKRPLMANVAQSYTDNIIVTNDNPRTEDPDTIIHDIMAGFTEPNQINIVKDRMTAIQWAIDHSNENDIILVAGKGHEDYQIIGQTKHHYSDRETVSDLLGMTL